MDMILMIISLVITLGAQLFVSGAYSKYSKVKNKKRMSGSEAARYILDKNGLKDVKVRRVGGYLSDYYDPRNKTVNLSSANYENASVGALSVACHECGHAIQDKVGYAFMRIRAALVPFVNFSSYAGYFAILFGCLFDSMNLIWFGIFAEMVILLFQIVTLPVEIDASKRAIKELDKYELLDKDELSGGKTMLIAAALTYVASVATTVIQILRLILTFGGRDDR
mgnify:FL=1